MLGYLLLLKPGVVSGIPALYAVDLLFDIGRVALLLLTVLALLRKRLRMDRTAAVLLLIVAFEGWKLVSTLLRGGAFGAWGAMLNTLGVALFTYVCLQHSMKTLLKSLSLLLGWYVMINTATVLLFPQGLYATSMYTANFFLSYRTAWFIFYFLAAVSCLLWHAYVPSGRTKRWLLYVLFCEYASMLLQWTVTGLICITLLLLFYALFRRGKWCFSLKSVFLAEAAAFVGLVFFQMQSVFSFVISFILHKDTTLSSRVRIWQNAASALRDTLLTGRGAMPTEEAKALLGYGVDHAHSYYLNTVLYFGVIGLMIGLAILCTGCAKRRREKGVFRIKEASAGRCVCMAALIGLMTAFQVEAMMSLGGYLGIFYLLAAAECGGGRAHGR